MTQGLFEGNVDLHTALIAIVPTVIISLVVAFAVGRLARRVLVSILGEQLSVTSPLVRGPLRLFSLAAFLLCSAVLIFPAFELAGVRSRTGVQMRTIGEWALEHGVKTVSYTHLTLPTNSRV